jgi:hypothetical protein
MKFFEFKIFKIFFIQFKEQVMNAVRKKVALVDYEISKLILVFMLVVLREINYCF